MKTDTREYILIVFSYEMLKLISGRWVLMVKEHELTFYIDRNILHLGKFELKWCKLLSYLS